MRGAAHSLADSHQRDTEAGYIQRPQVARGRCRYGVSYPRTMYTYIYLTYMYLTYIDCCIHSDPPNSGLALARQIAMISYRTPHGYHSKFGRTLSVSPASTPTASVKEPTQTSTAQSVSVTSTTVAESLSVSDSGVKNEGDWQVKKYLQYQVSNILSTTLYAHID